MKQRYPNLYNEAEDCCGCTACMAICSMKAIQMQYNSEGFLYPTLDKTRCVGCLRCEQVCAFKKNINTPISGNQEVHIYACKNKNSEVINNSSSGGIFTALSDVFLEQNNIVVSCVYSYTNNCVQYQFIKNKDLRDQARGSKYIQAEIGDFFHRIIEFLRNNENKKLLIFGTGCQVAGLDLLLKNQKLRERVILVDLICHGAASSKLWKEYVKDLEKKNGEKIDYITFKDKKNGWEKPGVFALIRGKKVSIKSYSDWFYMGLSLRESCYQCPYTRIDRNSDITIGDFWGIQNVMPEFYDKMGVSIVITHNAVGENLYEKIKGDISYKESSRQDCLQPRLCSPQPRPKNRDRFWDDIYTKGLKYCGKMYCEPDRKPLLNKMRRVLVKYLKK